MLVVGTAASGIRWIPHPEELLHGVMQDHRKIVGGFHSLISAVGDAP
jgi:hypothetical protein